MRLLPLHRLVTTCALALPVGLLAAAPADAQVNINLQPRYATPNQGVYPQQYAAPGSVTTYPQQYTTPGTTTYPQQYTTAPTYTQQYAPGTVYRDPNVTQTQNYTTPGTTYYSPTGYTTPMANQYRYGTTTYSNGYYTQPGTVYRQNRNFPMNMIPFGRRTYR